MRTLRRAERRAIAKRARELVKAGWVKGTWRAGRGKNVKYCLEGACNQAAIDVLGVKEAKELGASYGRGIARNGVFTDVLSVRDEAVTYAKEKGWSYGPGFYPTAANSVNDHPDTEKEDIIAILTRYIRRNR